MIQNNLTVQNSQLYGHMCVSEDVCSIIYYKGDIVVKNGVNVIREIVTYSFRVKLGYNAML